MRKKIVTFLLGLGTFFKAVKHGDLKRPKWGICIRGCKVCHGPCWSFGGNDYPLHDYCYEHHCDCGHGFLIGEIDACPICSPTMEDLYHQDFFAQTAHWSQEQVDQYLGIDSRS